MPEIPELSEVKRALLEKYLRGEPPQTAIAASNNHRGSTESSDASPSITSRTPLVTVQAGGSRRPFFFLHAHWYGGAFYCFTLARDMGSDQPFYILDPYRFDGLSVPPSIEVMAEAYVESLRAVQPEGPYLLGGFCAGGIIAFEIARRLRAEGEKVDLLMLIEPGTGPVINLRVGRLIRRIGGLVRLSPEKQLDWFLRPRYIYKFLRQSHYKNSERFSLNPSTETLRKDWTGIFVWSILDYVPREYPGKVTYFWTNDETTTRHRAIWNRVEAEEVELHAIPGTHVTCRTIYLDEMSDQLSKYVSRAQANILR